MLLNIKFNIFLKLLNRKSLTMFNNKDNLKEFNIYQSRRKYFFKFSQIIHYPEAELAHSQVYKNQNVYTSGVQRGTTQSVVYSNVGNVGGQTTTVVGGPTVVGGQTVVR
jgi:hypothetical protein